MTSRRRRWRRSASGAGRSSCSIPTTGEVLALASTPTYDASAIANPTTAKDTFEALQADPTQPLLPRATLGRYVPGSVFKIVTAVAGLGSGAITPGDDLQEAARRPRRTACSSSGFRVRDGHHPATGSKALDLIEATEVSCNIYYALTGLQTGGGCAGRLRRQDGLRRGAPVRPADRRLAGDQRRRLRARAGSPTTSSWPTPRMARRKRS